MLQLQETSNNIVEEKDLVPPKPHTEEIETSVKTVADAAAKPAEDEEEEVPVVSRAQLDQQPESTPGEDILSTSHGAELAGSAQGDAAEDPLGEQIEDPLLHP